MNLSSRCFVVMVASVLLSAVSPPLSGSGLSTAIRAMKQHSGFKANPLNSQIPAFAAIESQSHVVIARYEAIRNKELKGLLRTL